MRKKYMIAQLTLRGRAAIIFRILWIGVVWFLLGLINRVNFVMLVWNIKKYPPRPNKRIRFSKTKPENTKPLYLYLSGHADTHKI